MITIKNLNKFYGSTKVLNDISIDIKEGEIFAIVGHSGAGKSTLLRCINGLEDYSDGSLKVNDKEIKTLDKNSLREFRKNIGMIFQHFSLIQRKTVYENVALPMQLWGYTKSEIDTKVNDLLALVGLENKLNSYPSQLSGGQKQRVAIARALAGEPKFLLADEPTGNLDSANGEEVMNLLTQLNETGTTIVMVTHSPSDADRSHRIIQLFDGHIVTENMRQKL